MSRSGRIKNVLPNAATIIDGDSLPVTGGTLGAVIKSLGEGGPAGIYATVAALEAAFPTGDTRIYIVTADNNWYYWSGSAWTSGGVYADALLIDDASTALDRVLSASYIKGQLADIEQKVDVDIPAQLNEIMQEATKTLAYTTRVDYIVNSSGIFMYIAGYTVAQIPVKKGKTYTIKKTNGIGYFRIGFANTVGSSEMQLYDILNPNVPEYTFVYTGDYSYMFVNKSSPDYPATELVVTESSRKYTIPHSNSKVYVAASNSKAMDIAIADFVCDGVNDEMEIQAAVDSLTDGGTVFLFDGIYNIDGWNHTYNSTTDGGEARKIAFGIGITTERNQQNIGIKGMNAPLRQYNGKVPTCTAVINVTATALAILDSQAYNIGNVIGCLGYKGVDRLYPKYGLILENIGFLLADNQHVVRVVNAEMFSAFEMRNFLITPYLEGGTDTPFPIANDECVGVRGLLGSNSGKGYIIENGFIFGMGIGFDINGEHLVMTQCGVRFSTIPYRFGNNNKYGANTHDLTLINCCHEMCRKSIVFDAFTNYQSINLYDYNIEKHTTGDYAQTQKAIEAYNHAKGRGNIFYTVCDGTFINIEDTFFEPGHGKNFNCVNTTMRRSGDTASRPTIGNHLQEYFNTETLKKNIYYNGAWVEV